MPADATETEATEAPAMSHEFRPHWIADIFAKNGVDCGKIVIRMVAGLAERYGKRQSDCDKLRSLVKTVESGSANCFSPEVAAPCVVFH